MTITDAASVWEALQSAKVFRPQDYDKDLVESIRQELGCDPSQELPRDLQRYSAKQFIDAVLRSLAPWAKMLKDLLSLYEQVGASNTQREPLRVRYDFDDQGPDLDFDLATFREWERVTTLLTQQIAGVRWQQQEAWRLSKVFDWEDQPIALDRSAEWVSISGSRPTCQQSDADEAIAHAWRYLVAYVADVTSRWPDRRAVTRPANDIVTQDDAWVMATDYWDVILLQRLRRFAEYVNAQGAERAADLGRAARDAVIAAAEALPSFTIDVTTAVERLVSVLSLPIWGQRHEVYSAWVFTQIAWAVGLDKVDVHVVDGLLAFEFSGSHLATGRSAEGPLQFWTELRSKHTNPLGIGRKAAIQPDYSITGEPISSPTTTVLAVECKQYKTNALRNPAHAVADYTSGLPNAHVVLAMYGDVSDRVLEGLTDEQKRRATVVRGLRPGNGPALSRFEDVVQSHVKLIADVDARGKAPERRDLDDVYAWLTYSEIGAGPRLGARIVLPDGPWNTSWKAHGQSLGGIQHIRLSRELRVEFSVSVHEGSTLEECDAVLRVRNGRRHVELKLSQDSRAVGAHAWRGVTVQYGKIEVTNDFQAH